MAERSGNLKRATLELELALPEYPDDYALTLRLAWLYFLQQRYAHAERAYRAASRISKGAELARIGLSWSLVRQQRCAEAREVLGSIDTNDDTAKLIAAVVACEEATRLHGTVWGALGGTLYDGHPWKSRSADLSLGAALTLPSHWSAGAAYRGLRLSASDTRVANVDQHEGYLQAGYAGASFGLTLHGALLFAGYSALGRSEHIGIAGRWTKYGDALLELTTSFYPDLLVTRVAPAWVVRFGRFQLVPGLSVEHFARETLLSGSFNASVEVSPFSVSAGGKYGPEYRAAYLSRSAVFNSEDRSEWGVWISLRAGVSAHFDLFVIFTAIQLTSPDKLISHAQLLGLGASGHF